MRKGPPHPDTCAVAEKPEGHLSCRTPSPGAWGLQAQGSQPRAKETGAGAHVASSGEIQWGFGLPGRERSLLETQHHLPGASTPAVTAPAGECLPGPPTAGDTICHAHVQQRGRLAAPRRDLCGTLFLEKLLAETQTAIEQCSF